MASCIITGGAGFIGSHLTEALLDKGHNVLVIDNLSTGRLQNIQSFQSNPKFNFLEADINDQEKIIPHLSSVDYLFHLAALADIVPSIVNPLAYYRSNVNGTISILELIRKNCPNIKKIVYTASSSCYGIPDKYPTPETAEIRTEYPYALTKHLGEQIAIHWAKVYKLPINSLRLFNVYGPRSRTSGTYGAVFGVFLAQKLANKPYTVVGNGKQTRDFTYVADVASAFISAAESTVTGETFNVGSGNTYSINRLVDLLGGEITYIPKRPGEPDCTFADTTKIQKMLEWKPKVSFEEGVKRMLQNIDYWKEAPVWTPESINEATKDWFAYLGTSPVLG
ncbi:NAD-dependent dehydratase [candidate division WOR-1 bacterium RIFOXYC2_FULL_37_10]|uniref:NAD-dependent dehydratase n=1 Tax=candidate division WOR-1 bacterium RIFOXYB2_FULL_37_13 TaxID=1802579 RepID=A0A1F4SQB6_UNCSA|nr:MAG: NAD-dependent dehydratase [candidate division WOR-1 bacterium RIFOXYA2_FULL_37_7]OGC22638.1 MAG: NAD-dependent dehydratase [candidate division WOR-1 bacterium RIFOXYB2_FULL_37_13]OGC36284.1 MAG: NAD-dependent dehydratase [candidate division WOR-1 bacterium RIFOXYC2_FULL_37_10]